MRRKAAKKKAKPAKSLNVEGEWIDALAGWWGFYLTGTTPLKHPWPPLRPPPMDLRPVAFAGRIFFDGIRVVKSYFSINHNGYVGEMNFTPGDATNRIEGTYKLNPDRATGSIQYPPSLPSFPLGAKLNFVLTNGGSELFLISMWPAWTERLTVDGQPPPPEPLPGICLYGIAKRG